MIIVIIHNKFVKVKLYNESFTITQSSLKSPDLPTVNKNAVLWMVMVRGRSYSLTVVLVNHWWVHANQSMLW